MVSERDSTKEMSAREEKTALVEPLTVENYEEWKYKIKALLVTKKTLESGGAERE